MICFGPDEGWTLHHGVCLEVLPTLAGSTGKAADLEGCHFACIDSDAASCTIAAQRRRAQRSLPLAVEA